MSDIKLGQKVADRLTDFEGIVTAKAEHYAGCTTVRVTPEESGIDGAFDEQYDIERVEILDNGRMDDIPETEEEMFEEIQLGQRVRDTVTGTEGIATMLTEFAFSVPKVSIQPEADEDATKRPSSSSVDVTQVEIVGDGLVDERQEMVDGLASESTGDAGEMPRPH